VGHDDAELEPQHVSEVDDGAGGSQAVVPDDAAHQPQPLHRVAGPVSQSPDLWRMGHLVESLQLHRPQYGWHGWTYGRRSSSVQPLRVLDSWRSARCCFGRDKNGAGAVTTGVHLGGDVGESNSWRGGVSYLSTRAVNRSFDGTDPSGADVSGSFSGNSKVWLGDFVWKWAPHGNPYVNNFKFASEYFHRDESGSLDCNICTTGPYDSSQSGFYAQGVYQFMPLWRVGYRYDKLYRGSVDLNGSDIGSTIASLGDYNPSRQSLMVDWSPSEFTLIRAQYSLDKSTAGQDESQVFLQYIYSLGTHGAHKF
jgi:hypothetical protein